MATTFVCVRQHLPADLTDIVYGYFRTNTANLFIMANEGRYEECVDNVHRAPNEIFIGACRGGHRAIVDLAIANGSNKWEQALSMVAEEGYLDLVKIALDKGACPNSLDFGLACMKDRADVGRLLMGKMGNDNYCVYCHGSVADHWANA